MHAREEILHSAGCSSLFRLPSAFPSSFPRTLFVRPCSAFHRVSRRHYPCHPSKSLGRPMDARFGSRTSGLLKLRMHPEGTRGNPPSMLHRWSIETERVVNEAARGRDKKEGHQRKEERGRADSTIKSFRGAISAFRRLNYTLRKIARELAAELLSRARTARPSCFCILRSVPPPPCPIPPMSAGPRSFARADRKSHPRRADVRPFLLLLAVERSPA